MLRAYLTETECNSDCDGCNKPIKPNTTVFEISFGCDCNDDGCESMVHLCCECTKRLGRAIDELYIERSDFIK